MKKQNNIRIYKDKNGREYQKERYFIGGKMKFHRKYVIDGIPAEEFYEKNATAIEMVIDGNFHLIGDINDSDNRYDKPSPSNTKDGGEFPF